jgi:hypothetical protein
MYCVQASGKMVTTKAMYQIINKPLKYSYPTGLPEAFCEDIYIKHGPTRNS